MRKTWAVAEGFFIGSTWALPRHGIPSLKIQDAAQGFRTSTNAIVGQVTSWPSLLALAQFVASVLCSVGLKAAGAADVDELEWPRVRTYVAYIGLFTSAIFANISGQQSGLADFD